MVRLIEDYNVIPNAVYYSETLRSSSIDISEREMERMFWHNNSYAFLGKADLIFCDPDNVLTTKSVRAKDSEKFVVPEDIERYYNSGKNVVYYCHKGRRKSDAWEEAKTEMQRHIRDAKLIVMTYRKGTQRSYIFVVHPDCYQRYLDILNRFVEPFWYKAFWREPIYNIVPGDEEIGDQFEITLADKTVLTMKTQADGRIRIYFSETPGSSMVLTPEMLKRRLQGR